MTRQPAQSDTTLLGKKLRIGCGRRYPYATRRQSFIDLPPLDEIWAKRFCAIRGDGVLID